MAAFIAQGPREKVRTVAQFLGGDLNFFLGDLWDVASQRRIIQNDGDGGGRKAAGFGDISDGHSRRFQPDWLSHRIVRYGAKCIAEPAVILGLLHPVSFPPGNRRWPAGHALREPVPTGACIPLSAGGHYNIREGASTEVGLLRLVSLSLLFVSLLPISRSRASAAVVQSATSRATPGKSSVR